MKTGIFNLMKLTKINVSLIKIRVKNRTQNITLENSPKRVLEILLNVLTNLNCFKLFNIFIYRL